MSRQVLYVAAPLRPSNEEVDAIQPFTVSPGRRIRAEATRDQVREALRANLDRAMRWLAWLRKSFPETTFIAPWIATVLSLDGDDSPALREAGLVDDCAVVERCDGIVLCGGRISSGMRREMEHGMSWRVFDGDDGEAMRFEVYDLTKTLLALPHEEAPAAPRGRSFRIWYDQVVRGIA